MSQPGFVSPGTSPRCRLGMSYWHVWGAIRLRPKPRTRLGPVWGGKRRFSFYQGTVNVWVLRIWWHVGMDQKVIPQDWGLFYHPAIPAMTRVQNESPKGLIATTCHTFFACCLVVTGTMEFWITFQKQLGMSSSQLISYFSGGLKPPISIWFYFITPDNVSTDQMSMR